MPRGFSSKHRYIAVISQTPDRSAGVEEIEFTAAGSLIGNDAMEAAIEVLNERGYEPVFVCEVHDITTGDPVYKSE